MRKISIPVLISISITFSSDSLPSNFYKYSWYVIDASKKIWKELLICKDYLKYIFAQIEQETCISLRHRKCWSPYAELKTKREYGFGLGQITITKRFNNFKNFKKLFPSHLKQWKWEDRYNPKYQSLALVLYDKFLFRKVYRFSDNDYDRFCFMLSSYNGGLGWLIKDRAYCKRIKSCNPKRWFGHVEKYSIRKRYKLYGRKTSFDINREYVRNIMKIRYRRYQSITNEIIGCVIYWESVKSNELFCH